MSMDIVEPESRSKLETHQADEELLNSNNRLWASPYWSILMTIMTTSVLQGSVRYVDWCTWTLKNVWKTFSFRLLLSNLIVKTTELHKQIISWTAGDLSKMRQLTSRHENPDVTMWYYELWSPDIQRQWSFQALNRNSEFLEHGWNEESQRNLTLRQSCQVKWTSKTPKYQHDKSQKVSRPFCEYQQISTVNFFFSAPLRWTRPHVVATGRSPVAEAITNPFRFSAMAGVRPLHHLQGERPWHSPRRPSLFRSPSRWHGSDDIYIVICGKHIRSQLKSTSWSLTRETLKCPACVCSASCTK